MSLLCEIFQQEGFWTIVGVVIGFGLSEIATLVRVTLDRRKLKKGLEDELDSNRYIIAQKQDIIHQIIDALGKKQVLDGKSLHAVSMIYDNHIQSILKLLKPKQRDNIHLIYQGLKLIDTFMDEFEDNKRDIELKLMENPWTVYQSKLGELNKQYDKLRHLIENYLDNKPDDVFHRHAGQKEPPQKFSRKSIT